MTACGFLVATSGLQGAGLGSDETDIVLLGYALVDMARNQVLGIQEYVIKPTNADLNTNFLSEEVQEETRLTEAAIRTSGVTLSKALSLFASYCSGLGISPYSLTLLTDGQPPLRQCLHPETSNKEIPLPSYYNSFADLRKSIATMYASDSVFTSIPEILTFLDIPNSEDTSFFSKELRDMVNIIQRVISDGHKFVANETIQLYLEPGICSRDEEVDSNCVVRARGLPWQSSDQDIARFFRGLNVAKGGVALCLSPMGRRNGEALVRFTCGEHREMALKRHKHHIGTRYIEVYRATGDDFVNVAGGSNNEAQAFLTRGAQVIIRMRGLPYDCTAKQVIDFFEAGENPCSVMGGEEGVLFVRKPDGRSTGDAFVLFKNEEDSPKALARHRESIGIRYIELFRSTTAEVQQEMGRQSSYEAAFLPLWYLQAGPVSRIPEWPLTQVLNRTMEACEQPVTAIPQILPALPQVGLLPQHIITSGTRKDCIRLRGLPYEAQVENILEFLGDHAKNILFQGVHMVYNSQGQPSGEAFIQMDSEASAAATAALRHHRYMPFGKKHRYIEVWQCSGEDMSMVLSGVAQGQAQGVVSQPAVAAPQISPPPAVAAVPQGGGDCMRWGDSLYLVPRLPPPPPPHHPLFPPPLHYWPYASPPVSPPPAAPPLLIMCADYPIEGWGVDCLGNVQPIGLHTSA